MTEIEARRLRRAAGRAGSGSLAEEEGGDVDAAGEEAPAASCSPLPPPSLAALPLASLPLNSAAQGSSPELPPAALKAALPPSRLARAQPSRGPGRADKENRPAGAACGGA